MCVCLRASTPVVEDDQDIGESNTSVTIDIGGAGVCSWFTVVIIHLRVINVVIAIEFRAIRFAVSGASASTA